jgi:Holliday junction resolvase RusA-like endonuclease
MSARSVAFRVYGPAQPKGSARAFISRGPTPRAIVTSDNPRAKSWALLVASSAQAAAEAGPLSGALSLAITFWLPRPRSVRRESPTTRPDVDKLARCVLDALTGILYADDSQVVELYACKRYALGATSPHVAISLMERETTS